MVAPEWWCKLFHPRRHPIGDGYTCPVCKVKRVVGWCRELKMAGMEKGEKG